MTKTKGGEDWNQGSLIDLPRVGKFLGWKMHGRQWFALLIELVAKKRTACSVDVSCSL